MNTAAEDRLDRLFDHQALPFPAQQRQDNIAEMNINAICSFQKWVENDMVPVVGDKAYTALRKVLLVTRDLEEEVTVDDLKIVFAEVMAE